MTETRTYRQTHRADTTERTRAAILAAAQTAFRADPGGGPSLEAIAAGAGGSTRTVLRQFGSKERLLTAAIEVGLTEHATNRRVVPGDVEDAVRKLERHY